MIYFAPGAEVVPPPDDEPARSQCQLLIWTSSGLGWPLPVSTSDFRLNKKIAHLVLQWDMNSTGSFQPSCLKRTMEKSSSCLRSNPILVPIHSAGPSTTCQSTRFPGSSSRTLRSKLPSILPPAVKTVLSIPPILLSPWVSVVHQPATPSRVASAR